jgi:spore coat polysaccharide biosynthesis protein SpsF
MNIIIIQAHMGSTRLPGKVMKDLCGKAVLYHVYQRCKQAETIDKVIIATSTDEDNDYIELFCKQNNIDCFRGSESDVLDRYYRCALQYNVDIVVRVTSDCPFVEPKLIDYIVTHLQTENNIEFVKEQDGLFLGHGLDIFRLNALIKMKQQATIAKQKEHVIGYYLDYPEEFVSKEYKVPRSLDYLKRSYRLTLDTFEDYQLIKFLYEKFYKLEQDFVNLEDVIHFIDEHQELLSINNKVQHKQYL